jgi:hypothetical protein
MTRILFGLTALTLMGANIREADSPRLPTGQQPLQVLAHMDRDGNVVIRQTVPQYREEVRQRTRFVKENGRRVPVTETYKVTVVIQVPVTRKLPARSVHVYGTDGKKMDASALPKLLKKETVVLLSADGRPVDSFYLQLVRQGTLVLVHPQEKAVQDLRPEPVPEPKRPLVIKRP